MYHQKLYGPEFVWILHHNVRDNKHWVQKVSGTRCTLEQVFEALDYAFIINKMTLRLDDETKTASGLVSFRSLGPR